MLLAAPIVLLRLLSIFCPSTDTFLHRCVSQLYRPLIKPKRNLKRLRMLVVILLLPRASCCRFKATPEAHPAFYFEPCSRPFYILQASNCMALEQPLDSPRQREERLHEVEQMGYVCRCAAWSRLLQAASLLECVTSPRWF